MTNQDRWNLYTKDLPSPQSYIDLSFYWLITACLQRRVWFYSGDMPLFTNLFIALVGPPAVGKGIILGKVNEFLRFHDWKEGQQIQTNHGLEYPRLFPVGADSITFEELIDEMSKSIRRIVTPNKTAYIYISYAFVLEELDSLFKKKVEDVAKFLKNGYDCKPFEYKTKHHGQYTLKNPCLNFFAATNETFLKDAYKNKLFGEGFMSRTLFCFAKMPRNFEFHISNMTAEQKTAKEELLAWIKSLSKLYGEITYNAETAEWLDSWYKTDIAPKLQYCKNERMGEYYGRKKVTMLKLAAGMHFAEHLTFEIPLETFQRAIALLDSLEPAMAEAINFSGRNENNHYLRLILEYIKKEGKVSIGHIVRAFGADVDLSEIKAIMEELETGYGIKSLTENSTKYYLVPTGVMTIK